MQPVKVIGYTLSIDPADQPANSDLIQFNQHGSEWVFVQNLDDLDFIEEVIGPGMDGTFTVLVSAETEHSLFYMQRKIANAVPFKQPYMKTVANIPDHTYVYIATSTPEAQPIYRFLHDQLWVDRVSCFYVRRYNNDNIREVWGADSDLNMHLLYPRLEGINDK